MSRRLIAAVGAGVTFIAAGGAGVAQGLWAGLASAVMLMIGTAVAVLVAWQVEREPPTSGGQVGRGNTVNTAGPVTDSGAGPAAGDEVAVAANYGTVQQRYFHGEFARLREETVLLDLLPGELRLADPSNPRDELGMFTGRDWLLEQIDQFIAEQVAEGRGKYLLIEAEAGMGKSALATYLAFVRGWPTHVTRLETDPKATRTNLAAQLIARWRLTEFAPGGVLRPGHDTTRFLHNVLCDAAKRRDETEPGKPVVLVVDGLDEAPPDRMPFGLPSALPPGTVVVATTRPGVVSRMSMQAQVELIRLPVEDEHNHDDLNKYLSLVTDKDRRVAEALKRAGVDGEWFRRTVEKRSGGVWIYASSVVEQIRDGDWSPAEVDQLPAGLAGYYARNIATWRDEIETWERDGLPLLATLAAARDAQPAGILAGWARVDPEQAKKLLGGRFKPFLAVRDGGDPFTYTVRHQSLRELCEGRLALGGDDPLKELAYNLAEATHAAHERITEALTPPGARDQRDWTDADEYTRKWLAEHAAEAGRLDDLAADPGFLLCCEPSSFLRHGKRLTEPRSVAAVGAYEAALSEWSQRPGDERAWWLHVWARKTGAVMLAAASARITRRDPVIQAAMWAGTAHRTLKGHEGAVNAVAAVPLPGERTLLVSVGSDGTVRLWDPVTGDPAGDPLVGHDGGVRAVAVVPSPDERTLLATASGDGTVRLWDPDSHEPVRAPLAGHKGAVNAVAAVLLPDGHTRLATGGDDGTVRLWDSNTGNPVRDPMKGHNGPVRTVAVVPPLSGGPVLLATGGDDGTVRLWDWATGDSAADPITGQGRSVNAVALIRLPDGRPRLVIGCGDGAVRLWDPVARNAVPLTGHTGRVLAVGAVPLPDGSIGVVTAGADHTIRLWELSTGNLIGDPIEAESRWVNAVTAVSLADGRTLLAAGGSDGTVQLWDISISLPAAAPKRGHTGPVRAVAGLPLSGGRTLLASGGDDRTVRLWHPLTGQPAAAELRTGHAGSVRAVAAVPLPDGRIWLATGGDDQTVRLWEWNPFGHRSGSDPLTGHAGVLRAAAVPVIRRATAGVIRALAAVPLGDRVLLAVGGDDRTVRLWDPSTGQPAGSNPLTGHGGSVQAATVVPLADGRVLLATGGSDGMVQLWDPATGRPLSDPLTGHAGRVWAVAAVPRPDGRTLLATGGDFGTVRLWDPATGEFLRALLNDQSHRVTALAAVATGDGQTLLATGGDDGMVRLWEPITGRSVGDALPGHGGKVNAVVAVPLPDGRAAFATGGHDNTIFVWAFRSDP